MCGKNGGIRPPRFRGPLEEGLPKNRLYAGVLDEQILKINNTPYRPYYPKVSKKKKRVKAQSLGSQLVRAPLTSWATLL